MEAEIMRYESLICNAFKCRPGGRHGARKGLMKNLMKTEQGAKIKGIGSHKKQLEDIKKYLSKALIKLSKTKPYSKSSGFFTTLDMLLSRCNHSSELMVIVNHAMERVIILRDSLYF